MTAEPRPLGRPRVSPAGAVPLIVLLIALVAACGSAAPSGTPVPSGAAGASASAGTGEQPSPTHWPGGVVEAVVILAKADLEIQNAGADLGAAAAYEDLQMMWGAADGLATLVTKLQTQIPRIADYPETAAAAKSYDLCLPDMLAGARKVADSIKAGDAAGLTTGSQQLAQGLQAYAATRRLLGPLADQAFLMQKLLLK
ncbi:MAG: hypothetical protein WCK58_10035 [Chloroflexota bacterium]